MIRELSDLGKKLREINSESKLVHDAIKDEPISIDLIIDKDGSFVRFEPIEKILRPAEAITAKKGKARLLLDKAEEVLAYNGEEKKHNLYIEKLNLYKSLTVLEPVFLFYEKNKAKGIKKAVDNFEKQLTEKERSGNIAFRVEGMSKRIHEEKAVYKEIIKQYEKLQRELLIKKKKRCSICGTSDYPVEDIPHGVIKNVPDGQVAGCTLVSYNEKAFESYDLSGNNNSSVCTNCARTYVEGLNWLLNNGTEQKYTDSKGKEKDYFRYSNRYPFRRNSADTAMVFWTRNNSAVAEIDLLEEPKEGDIVALFDSVAKAKSKAKVDSDYFYSFSLSGAAARIAVRDWIEQSLSDVQQAISLWFKDIAIDEFDYSLQRQKTHYSRLYDLARSAHNEKSQNDVTSSRIAVLLWRAALKKQSIPLWVLTSVLKRTRVDDKGVTADRAALIKITLNRNNNNGGYMMKESIDELNNSTAYVCGRIFSVLEGIQRAALGKTNAGIRERFFSFASTSPSSAFGRLMRMSQNHLSKLQGEKPGLAVILDKELQALFARINGFPLVFSLEEQGQFAIGYYHQKNETFKKAAENKELKDALEHSEEKGE